MTLAWAINVASFALGTTGAYVVFKGSLRVGIALLAASLILQLMG
jgi:hypothetical protein